CRAWPSSWSPPIARIFARRLGGGCRTVRSRKPKCTKDRMMKSEATLRFKISSEEHEFEAVHRLNYKTFVEEIPQHERNSEQRLVDKFHAQNTYAICLNEGQLVGMVTGRGQRPFSLDQKVPGLETHLPPGHKILEVRL